MAKHHGVVHQIKYTVVHVRLQQRRLVGQHVLNLVIFENDWINELFVAHRARVHLILDECVALQVNLRIYEHRNDISNQ